VWNDVSGSGAENMSEMHEQAIHFYAGARLFLEVPCENDSFVFMLYFFRVYKPFMAVFEWYGVI